MPDFSPKSTAMFAIATMVAATMSTPVFAEKMKNEWTVSSIKAPDAEAPAGEKEQLGSRNGAGKVNAQDACNPKYIDISSSDLTCVNKKQGQI